MEYEIEANEPVSFAVVRAVSAVEGKDPTALPPLAEVLDPESLDSLFTDGFNGKSLGGGRVSFVYSNCRLTVDNAEYLTIEPIDPQWRRAED